MKNWGRVIVAGWLVYSVGQGVQPAILGRGLNEGAAVRMASSLRQNDRDDENQTFVACREDFVVCLAYLPHTDTAVRQTPATP